MKTIVKVRKNKKLKRRIFRYLLDEGKIWFTIFHLLKKEVKAK